MDQNSDSGKEEKIISSPWPGVSRVKYPKYIFGWTTLSIDISFQSLGQHADPDVYVNALSIHILMDGYCRRDQKAAWPQGGMAATPNIIIQNIT